MLRSLTDIASTRGRPRYLVPTSDREMAPALYRDAEYEGAHLRWVLDHLGHPQAGRTLVDIGANLGTTTIPALVEHGAAAAIAFEPAPVNFDLLRCNLILNGVEDRVDARRIAISDRRSVVELELCSWNSGDNRVRFGDVDALELLQESAWTTVSVEAHPLDDVLEATDVGLVWVDTQGHEAHVLGGAERLLARRVPWVIEYWPYGLNRVGGLARLHEAIDRHFTSVVDVRRSLELGASIEHRPADVPAIGAALGEWYTDLVLVP